ncbi:MAG: hypothetical protein MZU97_24140 [Bacillus subtilis]|nr:hypothetical protein [Bacillus subtilis]
MPESTSIQSSPTTSFRDSTIGGVVGAAAGSALTMKNIVNNAPITGFGTSSTFNLASGNTAIVVRIGGVIGYVLHTPTNNHGFIDIANKAQHHIPQRHQHRLDCLVATHRRRFRRNGRNSARRFWKPAVFSSTPIITTKATSSVPTRRQTAIDSSGRHRRCEHVDCVRIRLVLQSWHLPVHDYRSICVRPELSCLLGLSTTSAPVALTLTRVYNYGDFAISIQLL